MSGRNGQRTTVALVAHGVHDGGGMERAFAELLRRANGDVRFVVLASELDDELRGYAEWRRIRVPRRPIPLKMLVFAIVAGIRLARTRADVVHTLGAIVPNHAHVATVQHCHAGARAAMGRLAPAESPPARRFNTALKRLVALAGERWCYRPSRTRSFGAVSPGVARELARHYPGVRVALTPNGVDTDRHGPDAAARADLRAEVGIDGGAFVALFVGGDWDHKGVAVAIQGLAEAQRRGLGDARLLVVGRGDVERFQALATEHGVGDRVHFAGPQRDTSRWYQAADVFVLPTLYETFSLVAYEAAATMLPVVATAVSGIEDLVGDDDAGITVERTASSVGDALLRLAADPELRRRLGEEGRRRAARYGWDRSVDSVLSLYRSVQVAT